MIRPALLSLAAWGVVLVLSSLSLADRPSWIFLPSTFSHDPQTGARVAQYMRKPPIEPLPDQRLVTSRHRRTRTTLRGTDGSVDTEYQVRNWGNGRGGLDAEWERFHDAWKESYLTGSNYQSGYGDGSGSQLPYGYKGAPYGYGHQRPGYGAPGYGAPGHGSPGHGGPGYGAPGHAPAPGRPHVPSRPPGGSY